MIWKIEVEGGPAYMANLIAALTHAARERPIDSPSHQILTRLIEACKAA